MKLKEISINYEYFFRHDQPVIDLLALNIQKNPGIMTLLPIVLEKSGLIYSGNFRYKALQKIGFANIPETWIRYIDDLNRFERLRYIYSDQIINGQWTGRMVLLPWEAELLTTWGFEVEPAIN